MLLTMIVLYLVVKDSITFETTTTERDDFIKLPKEPTNALPDDPDDKQKQKAIVPEEPSLPHNWSDIMANTTTCEQFLANSTFDPFKVLDIDWKIWYYWNQHFEESYEIRFSIPSRTLVDRFRVELDEEIQPRVEWDDAILFMETTIDFSALYIKTEKDGQFRVIPSLAFEFSRLPEVVFGIKVIDPPGYMALMNCKYRICYALAPVNKMPYYLTYEEEAKKIGFRGEYGQPHIGVLQESENEKKKGLEDEQLAGVHDDDGEDRHLEIQKRFNEKMYDEEAKKIDFRGGYGWNPLAASHVPIDLEDDDELPPLFDNDEETQHSETYKPFGGKVEMQIM